MRSSEPSILEVGGFMGFVLLLAGLLIALASAPGCASLKPPGPERATDTFVRTYSAEELKVHFHDGDYDRDQLYVCGTLGRPEGELWFVCMSYELFLDAAKNATKAGTK
jgi:hypothetical protein